MASAAFSIDPGTTVYGASLVAQDAAAAATVHCRIDSVSGVNTFEWSIIGTHSSSQAKPTITLSGSPTGQIASFTLPAGLGQAYGIQLKVNSGIDNADNLGGDTKSSAVFVLDASGNRPFFVGEVLEEDATHGWTTRLNAQISSGLIGTGTDRNIATWDAAGTGLRDNPGYSIDAAGVVKLATVLEVGGTVSTAGTVRLPDTGKVYAWGPVNDIALIEKDAGDNVTVGVSGSGTLRAATTTLDGISGVRLKHLGTIKVWVNGSDVNVVDALTIGSGVAGTGFLRMPDLATIRASGATDISVAEKDASDNLYLGSSAAGTLLANDVIVNSPFTNNGSRVSAPTEISNADTPYTVLATDHYISVDTSAGVVQVDLPAAASSTGRILHVYDSSGDAFTSNITLDANGGELINGATTFTMLTNYQGLTLQCDGTGWTIVASFVQPDVSGANDHVAWSFASPAGGGGTIYTGGFYDFGATANDFQPVQNFGTANAANAAHIGFVCDVPTAGQSTYTVAGTSQDDDGTRTGADSEVVTFEDTDAVNTYKETTKKFTGLVTITGGGTVRLVNYMRVKYYDHSNVDFRVLDHEVNWLAGAADAGIEIDLLHHKATGWTYNAGAIPTHPTAISSLTTQQGAESEAANGENGDFKHTGLNTLVNGGGSEGIMYEITTTGANTFRFGSTNVGLRHE